ncbi:hypothetical protein E2C01_030071 [Portunus trituberculatus]|uniref:Uncharacterized protein n=1 Tax=Portunus trituberculatus TaxID=210409 RepID=A0A5B7ETP6_PORTR|nr:hypothetical protein [Portunus trituberculatus]
MEHTCASHTKVSRAGATDLFHVGAGHPCDQDALRTERTHASLLDKRKEATGSGVVGFGQRSHGALYAI